MTGRPSRGSRSSARRPPSTSAGDGVALTRDDVPGPAEDDLGDPEAVGRAVCLRALTGAPKTRQQLADLLSKRGVPQEAADAVLDRLGEVGLVDDAAFARAWVSSRQAGRGLARRALKDELRAKGVDADVAAQAVGMVDDEDERSAARRLVQRRLPALQRLDEATTTRRLLGMLARKGYSSGMAMSVVREALDELSDSAADAVPGHGDEVLPSGAERLLP